MVACTDSFFLSRKMSPERQFFDKIFLNHNLDFPTTVSLKSLIFRQSIAYSLYFEELCLVNIELLIMVCRGGGFISLENLIFFAKTYPVSFFYCICSYAFTSYWFFIIFKVIICLHIFLSRPNSIPILVKRVLYFV